MPPLLVRFRRAYPAIELRMEVGNTESVALAVLQDAADLGFVEGDIPEASLSNMTVEEDRMVVVVARDHPWADGHPLALSELSAMHWILREPGSGTRSAFENALAGMGIAPGDRKVAISLPSNEAIRSAMSALVVASDLRVGLLAKANLELPVRRFSMLRHPDRHLSRATAAFEASLHDGRLEARRSVPGDMESAA